jgi:hypothetical protein
MHPQIGTRGYGTQRNLLHVIAHQLEAAHGASNGGRLYRDDRGHSDVGAILSYLIHVLVRDQQPFNLTTSRPQLSVPTRTPLHHLDIRLQYIGWSLV